MRHPLWPPRLNRNNRLHRLIGVPRLGWRHGLDRVNRPPPSLRAIDQSPILHNETTAHQGVDRQPFDPLAVPWRDLRSRLQLCVVQHHLPSQIDEREIHRAGPSYTIDTLQELRRETGERTSLVLFIGADQLLRLDTWRHWRDLFSFAHVVVATRPGFDLALLPPVVADEWQARRCSGESMRERPAGGFSTLTDQHYDISATDIRTRLKAVAAHPAGTRSMLEELLPTSVLNYIETNTLYND